MNIVLSLALLFSTIRAEAGQFTIYQDGKKMGTEEFTIRPVQKGYLIEGRTILTDPAHNVDLTSRMELDASLKPTSYHFESKGNYIRLKVGDPTSELEYTLKGQRQTDDIRFPANGVILDSNFFHHYALLLYRLGVAGSGSLAAFVPQQLTVGLITVRNLGNNTYEIDSEDIRVVATTDREGRLIRLAVPDAKVVVER